jgi:RimJ/RimL family protein N-acetyltransferase
VYRVPLACAIDNKASRRVILANGGVPDGQAPGEDRFWIRVKNRVAFTAEDDGRFSQSDTR